MRLMPIGLIGILFASGCSDCGSRKEKPLLALVPADVAGAVILPDVRQTVADLKALLEKFSVGPLALFLRQGHEEIRRLLGLDPLSISDLEKLGLAPERGLALVPSKEATLVVVGVASREAFAGELKKRMSLLFAADKVQTETIQGVEVVTLAAPVGQSLVPRLKVAFSGNYAVLASGETPSDRLAQACELPVERSLANAGWYNTLALKVSANADLLGVVNASKTEELGPWARDLVRYVKDGMVLGLSLDPTGISLEAYIGLEQAGVDRLAAYSTPVADPHLERTLPEDTAFALKVRLNAGRLLDDLLASEAEAKTGLRKVVLTLRESAQVDLEKGAVRNLTGNLVLGLSLGKADQMNRLLGKLAAEFGPAKPAEAPTKPAVVPTKPAEAPGAYQLFTLFQVQNAGLWTDFLDKALPVLAKEARLTIERQTVLGLTAIRLGGGSVSEPTAVVQKGDLVGLCVGVGAVERLAERIDGKVKGLPDGLPPPARKLYEENSLLVASLSFAALTDTLAGLDTSLFGEAGMLAKIVLNLVISTFKNLGTLTAEAQASPAGITFGLHVSIQ